MSQEGKKEKCGEGVEKERKKRKKEQKKNNFIKFFICGDHVW